MNKVVKKAVLTAVALGVTAPLFAQNLLVNPNKIALNVGTAQRLQEIVLDVQKNGPKKSPVQAQEDFEKAYEEYVALGDSATQEQKNKAFVKMAQAYMNVPDRMRIVRGESSYFMDDMDWSQAKPATALLEAQMPRSKELFNAYGHFRKLVIMDAALSKAFNQVVNRNVKSRNPREEAEALLSDENIFIGMMQVVKLNLKSELEKYMNEKMQAPETDTLHRTLD